jgi:hypothetical protein
MPGTRPEREPRVPGRRPASEDAASPLEAKDPRRGAGTCWSERSLSHGIRPVDGVDRGCKRWEGSQ